MATRDVTPPENRVLTPKDGAVTKRVDRHDKCRLCRAWTHASHMHVVNLSGKDVLICSTCVEKLAERKVQMDTSLSGTAAGGGARPSERTEGVGAQPFREGPSKKSKQAADEEREMRKAAAKIWKGGMSAPSKDEENE